MSDNMTPQELIDKLCKQEKELYTKDLLNFCKQLEPQLRDLGAHNTADRLLSILAAIEDNERQFVAAIENDPAAILTALLAKAIKTRAI